jgi:hypothetical protein
MITRFRSRNLLSTLLVSSTLAVLPACKEGDESSRPQTNSRPDASAASVQTSPDGVVVVTLQPKAQERLAIQLLSPKVLALEPEVKAYGRVLDPAPLVSVMTDLENARNTLELSRRELRRVRTLHDQDQNASERALETAETAFRRDELALLSVRLKFIAAWGMRLADQEDLSSLVRALARREFSLVRLDLPAGQVVKEPRSARLSTLGTPETWFTADLLGPAPDVDIQTQGQSFLVLVKTNTEALRPGQALSGCLQQTGDAISGMLVPASAIVRAQGSAWVFVQTSPSTFARREILLDHPADGGWLVLKGISSGDKLVVAGAQLLYSEELKRSIPTTE